ncbi:zinc ribbon domain-containing protein [Haloarchaeobius sp. DYHT-AS-18]|uniref:zinc ribbon domain-containing protein n=1 Tax=Haloarchaeobius sp. DYHT-AS-18 TaxID=3446117 RepID=UPI003EBE7E76
MPRPQQSPTSSPADCPADDDRDQPAPQGCPKCDRESVTTDLVSTTGSGLARLFDIKTRQFRVVTCEHCGYSEFYDDSQTAEADVVDTFLA